MHGTLKYPSGPLTPQRFAGELRRLALTEGEVRRANRSPDRPLFVPSWKNEVISPAIADALEALAEQCDSAMAPDAWTFDGAEVPQSIADELLRVVDRIEIAAPRRSAMAGSRQRSLAARGRAAVLQQALRQNDLAVAGPWVARMLADFGPVPGMGNAEIARLALRVLIEVAKEESQRELGIYTDDPHQLAPSEAAQPPSPPLDERAACLVANGWPDDDAPLPPEEPGSKLASAYMDEWLACCDPPDEGARTALDQFIRVAGDKPPSAYGTADFVRFRASIRKQRSSPTTASDAEAADAACFNSAWHHMSSWLFYLVGIEAIASQDVVKMLGSANCP